MNLQRNASAVIFFLFFCGSPAYPQQNFPPAKTIFLELGGSAGAASLNYDRVFFYRSFYALSYRGGFSLLPTPAGNSGRQTGFIFPFLFTALSGEKNHHAEIGFGQTVYFSTALKGFARAALDIGYRFQKPGGGIFFRAAYTPLVSYLYEVQYENWFGVSIGYTHKNKRDE